MSHRVKSTTGRKSLCADEKHSLYVVTEEVDEDDETYLPVQKGDIIHVFHHLNTTTCIAVKDDKVGQVAYKNVSILNAVAGKAVNISERPISYGRKKELPMPSKSPFPHVTVIDCKTYPVEEKKVTVFFMKVTPKTTGTPNSAPVKVIAKTLSCFWKLKEEMDSHGDIDRVPVLPPLTIYLNSDSKKIYDFLELALEEWFVEVSNRPTLTDLDCTRKFISTDRVMVMEESDGDGGDGDKTGDGDAHGMKFVEELVWPLVRTWAPARYDLLEVPPEESEIRRFNTTGLLDDDLSVSSSVSSEPQKIAGGSGGGGGGAQDELFKESVASMLAFGSESEDEEDTTSKRPSAKGSANKAAVTSKQPSQQPQQQPSGSSQSGGGVAPIVKSKTVDGLEFGNSQRRNRAASFINAQAMAAAYSASAAAGRERMETFQGGIARTATRSFGDSETGASLFENNFLIFERPRRSYSNLLFNINNIMSTNEDDLEALESSRSALAQLSYKSLEIYINRQKKKQEEYELKSKQRSGGGGSTGSAGHSMDDMSSKSASPHPHPHPHGGANHRHSMPANKFSPKILKDLESVLFDCNRKEESKKRQFGADWEVVGSIPPPDCREQDNSVFACLLLDDLPLHDSDIQKLKQDLLTASTVAKTTANKPLKANQAVTIKYERMKVMLKSLSKFRLSCLQMLQIFSILESHNVGSDEWTYLALISIVKLTDTSLLVEGYPKLWPKDLHPPNLHVEFEKRCYLALQVIHYEIKVECTSREIHAICANSICELRRARQLIKNAAILNVGIPLGARIKALEEHTTEPMKLLIKQSQIRIEEASAKIRSAQGFVEQASQCHSQLAEMGTDLSGLFMRGSTAQCSTSESEDLVLQALKNLLQQSDLAQTKAKSYFIEASLLQSTIKKCSTEIEAVQTQLNHHKASLSDRMKKKWGQAKTGTTAAGTTTTTSSSQGTEGAAEGASAVPVKKSIQGGSLAGAGLKKLNPANANANAAGTGAGTVAGGSTPKSSLAGSSLSKLGLKKVKPDSQSGADSSSTNSPKASGPASATSSPVLGTAPHPLKLGGAAAAAGVGGAAPSPSSHSGKSTAIGTNWRDESKEDNPLAKFAELISIKNKSNPSGKSTQSQKGKKTSPQTPETKSNADNTLLYLLMAKLPLVRDLRKLLKEEEEEAKKNDKKPTKGVSKISSKSSVRATTHLEYEDNAFEEEEVGMGASDMRSNTSILGDDSDLSSIDGTFPENPRFKELKVGKHSLQWARRRKSIRIELPTYCIGTRGGLGRKDFVLSAGELDENMSVSDTASLVDEVDC